MNKHGIAFHEKTKGQLFCDTKEGQIVKLLLDECQQKTITLQRGVSVERVEKIKDRAYQLRTTAGTFACESLIVATGGLSIPSMGSSPWGYQVAEQFGLPVHPLRAGLVPLTLHDEDKARLSPLSGVSFDTVVRCRGQSFHEHSLMTHRGLSGPAMLQISSYWQAGQAIEIDCLPQMDIVAVLQNQDAMQSVKTYLSQYLTKRFLDMYIDEDLLHKALCRLHQRDLATLREQIHSWVIKPNGTEGYRTAEVTLGGVDCDYLSSKTMEASGHKGLYFVGEVLDVTGWLGGYNFQWAWSSGFVAGQHA